jgi:cytoskeletal protein RodZ
MTTVAQQLRQAREAKQLTVEQVAEITKIRTDHIRALEDANFDVFSAPVYIRGFVRTYAGLLKLEVSRVMAELDAELSQTQKFAEPPSLLGEHKGILDFIMLQFSKINWQRSAVMLAGAAVIVLLIGGSFLWWHSRPQDPMKNLKPGVYQSNQTLPGETLTLPPPAPAPTQKR